jgi:hypothetical protein
MFNMKLREIFQTLEFSNFDSYTEYVKGKFIKKSKK